VRQFKDMFELKDWAIASDGRTIALMTERTASDLYLLEGF
jgi:hypothetical protein